MRITKSEVLLPFTYSKILVSHMVKDIQNYYFNPSNNLEPGLVCFPQTMDELALHVYNISHEPIELKENLILGTLIRVKQFYCLDFKALEELDDIDANKTYEMTTEQIDSLDIDPALTEHQKENLIKRIKPYADCFSWQVDDVGHFKYGPELEIDTGEAPPVVIPPYALGSKEKEYIKKQLDEWLKIGIIRPSTSNYCVPIFLVPKPKPGEFRLCVNFKFLNSVTKQYRFPLPLISDLFQTFRKSKYFSALDFNQGFLMFDIAEKDKYKTGFQTSDGHYEFNRIPFGIAAGPSHFTRMMKIIFQDFINSFIILYIDDLTIYSNNYSEHLAHLEKALKRILRAQIKLRAIKCSFGYREIVLLGHRVSGDGIKPSFKLIKAITEMPAM